MLGGVQYLLCCGNNAIYKAFEQVVSTHSTANYSLAELVAALILARKVCLSSATDISITSCLMAAISLITDTRSRPNAA